MFQPTKHAVTLGEESLYSGTDYGGIRIEKAISDRLYRGTCGAQMQVLDTKSMSPVLGTSVPEAVRTACSIKTGDGGIALPFLMSTRCASETRRMQMLQESMVAVMRAQICMVVADTTVVFTGAFVYD